LEIIAHELVDRRYQVYWYTGSEFQPKVTSTGARFIPAVDLSPEWMARRNALQGVAQLKYGFIDAAVKQVKDFCQIFNLFSSTERQNPRTIQK
jgi:UDP:flavonoid glycosyltransferase YjiC (YdhE family)